MLQLGELAPARSCADWPVAGRHPARALPRKAHPALCSGKARRLAAQRPIGQRQDDGIPHRLTEISLLCRTHAPIGTSIKTEKSCAPSVIRRLEPKHLGPRVTLAKPRECPEQPVCHWLQGPRAQQLFNDSVRRVSGRAVRAAAIERVLKFVSQDMHGARSLPGHATGRGPRRHLHSR